MRRKLKVEMTVQEGGRKRCRSSPAEQRSLGLFSKESGGEEPVAASPRQARGPGGLRGWLGKVPRLLTSKERSVSPGPRRRCRRTSVSPSLDTVAEVAAGGARRRFAS